jgi:hypothetical protein
MTQAIVTIIDGDGSTSTSARILNGQAPEDLIADRIDEFRRSRGRSMVLPLVIHYSEQS